MTLRPWQTNDIDDLIRYANNPRIAANLTNAFPNPYLKENGHAFIEMAISHQPTRIFAITHEDIAIGGIGLHLQTDVYARNAELGYWLAEPFWGKGIMSEAIHQITEYGFKTFDIDRIFARPFGSNVGSQRALEKNGFVLEAHLKNTFYKNEHYEDELIYALRKKTSLA
ncbi:MAG: GNAT family N-acetyltransferase [Flavobacteriales bacterium]